MKCAPPSQIVAVTSPPDDSNLVTRRASLWYIGLLAQGAVVLDKAISLLIEAIYQAPYEGKVLTHVLDQILWRTGGRFLLLSQVDLKSQTYSKCIIHGPDDARFLDGVREYESEMYRKDPLLSFAAKHPTAGYASSRTLMAKAGVDPMEDPYFAWTTGQLRSGHNAVCYSQPRDDLTVGISTNLPASVECFSPEQLELFRLLFGHFDHALRLAARSPIVEMTQEPVFMVDKQGKVISMSSAAIETLAEGDGLSLVSGRLCASDHKATQALHGVIAAVASAPEIGLSRKLIQIPRSSRAKPWLISAEFIPHSITPNPYRADVVLKIIVRKTEIDVNAIGQFSAIFGLTPIEHQLLNLMFRDDCDIKPAAASLSIRYSTARVHLRNIMGKAQVRGQAQLMRLLERLAHQR